MLRLVDARNLPAKWFTEGRWYRLCETEAVPCTRGPLVLLVANDGVPSWVMRERFTC